MAPQPGTHRTDVHAVRAVAVVLVLGYHLGIGVLPGGFVGVDAFFVVSGFLITGQLVRELGERGHIDLPAFWARRARRLAPAALVVLAVTGVAAWALSPREDWPTLGAHLAASAVSVENWALAASNTDYLAAGSPSTPFEHFWSLGVEEQFYLVWPLLLLGAWWGGRRLHRCRRAVVAVVVTVTAVSLVCSVVLTALAPAAAYTWPHTRAWEFGIGALVALAPSVPAGRPRLRAALAATGWTTLVVCALLLPPTVPYPGTAAALPVAATALVVAARAETGLPGRLADTGPVRWLGRVSYPLYLWHWPVVLLLPRAVDLPTPLRVAATVGLSLLLAQLTHVLVERPVASGRPARLRPRVTLAVVAAATALLLVVPAAGWVALTTQRGVDSATAAELTDADPCFGAAAIVPGSGCAVSGTPDRGVIPATVTAAYDVDPTWDACHADDTDARSCVVGVRGGTRVALVGDSHAHQWSSAVTALAEERGWELHLFVKGGCAFSHVRWSDVSAGDRSRCDDWNAAVDRTLAAQDPYALVLTSARADLRGDAVGADPEAAALDGYRASWLPLIARGTTVVALRDTPAAGSGVQSCVDGHTGDPGRCRIDTARAFASADRLADAARRTPGAVVVDMTASFCTGGECPAVIGNVLVYRDSQHLTQTYVRTLVEPLGGRLDAALRRAGRETPALAG